MISVKFAPGDIISITSWDGTEEKGEVCPLDEAVKYDEDLDAEYIDPLRARVWAYWGPDRHRGYANENDKSLKLVLAKPRVKRNLPE